MYKGFILSLLMVFSVSVVQAEVVSIKELTRLAQEGDVKAQSELGFYYFNSVALSDNVWVKKNHKKALFWNQRAAEHGDAMSQNRLSIMYQDSGYGVGFDPVRAYAWKYIAATQIPYHGTGRDKLAESLNPDQLSKAEELIEELMQQIIFNSDKSLAELLRQAKKEDPKAQYELGKKYGAGEVVGMRDHKRALLWKQRAAENGYAKAQFEIGRSHYEQLLIDENDEQSITNAVKWYRKAAEQGNPEAQEQLGNLYEAGIGVKKDLAEAVSLYERAAKQGNKFAQLSLISIYREEGILKNVVQEYVWVVIYYARQVRISEEGSEERISTLEESMNSDQISEAKKLIEEYTQEIEQNEKLASESKTSSNKCESSFNNEQPTKK